MTTRSFEFSQNIELSLVDRRRMLGRVIQLPGGPLMAYVFAPLDQTEAQLKSLLSMLFINGLLAILGADRRWLFYGPTGS